MSSEDLCQICGHPRSRHEEELGACGVRGYPNAETACACKGFKSKRVDHRIKYGKGDDKDPEWLEEHVTIDEIEMWLTSLMSNTKARVQGGRYLFSDWEQKFVESVNTQYDRKHAAGFHERPLTGKQLVYLKIMLDKLMDNTIEQLNKI